MIDAPYLHRHLRPQILTFDNGGTKTRVALMSGPLMVGEVLQYPTPHAYQQAMEQFTVARDKLMGKRGPDAVGFSIAGAVEAGRIVLAGQLQANGWVGKPFAQDVATALNVSEAQIALLNDCVAGANAERIARQPKEGDAGAFLAISTGVGGALYTANEVYPDEPGHKFLRAGAICGCGEDGHLEAHVSGSGIERQFGRRGEDIPAGDPIWQGVKRDLADGLYMTLMRYEDELGLAVGTIGFAGSVALGGPRILESLQKDLLGMLGERTPLIARAHYLDESGLYGAAFAAADVA